MGASIFSEALWQRVWASQDRKTLKLGAVMGATLVILVVFLTGLFGFLAAWAGLIDEDTNPNLYLFQVKRPRAIRWPYSFTAVLPLAAGHSDSHCSCDMQVFKMNPAEGGNTTVNNWVGVLIMVLAVTMNESAIDSFQNGIASSLSTRYLIHANITWIRLLVILVNIPFVIIALLGLDVLSLFLITNMLTTACMVPVMMGIYRGPACDYLSDGMVGFSSPVPDLPAIFESKPRFTQLQLLVPRRPPSALVCRLSSHPFTACQRSGTPMMSGVPFPGASAWHGKCLIRADLCTDSLHACR